MKNKSLIELEVALTWCWHNASKRRAFLEVSDPTLVEISNYQRDITDELSRRVDKKDFTF